jgi:hypothetical protein
MKDMTETLDVFDWVDEVKVSKITQIVYSIEQATLDKQDLCKIIQIHLSFPTDSTHIDLKDTRAAPIGTKIAIFKHYELNILRFLSLHTLSHALRCKSGLQCRRQTLKRDSKIWIMLCRLVSSVVTT